MRVGKRFAFGVTSLLLMSHLPLWPRRLQEATKCQTARSEPTITQEQNKKTGRRPTLPGDFPQYHRRWRA